MPLPRTVKFQHWLMGLLTLAVVGLTAAFLLLVLARLQASAETAALAKYRVISERLAEQLHARLEQHILRAHTVAEGAIPALMAAGPLQTEPLVTLLKASLNQYTGAYSEYFGLANGDFTQVVAVRNETWLRDLLQAPPGTQTAVRRLRGQGAKRTERWEFLGQNDRPLGQRQAPSQFDPTQRPWYQVVKREGGVHLSDPYLFESTKRGGATISAPLPKGIGVYGIDISLHTVPLLLAELDLSANALVVILDHERRILAAHGRGQSATATATANLTALPRSQNPELHEIADWLPEAPRRVSTLIKDEHGEHVLALQPLDFGANRTFYVVSYAPLSDFTADLKRAQWQMVGLAAGLLALLWTLALLGTRRVTHTLAELAADSAQLRQLDFSRPPHRVRSSVEEIDALADAQEVMHHSIRERTQALERAQHKLSRLVDSGIALGREQQREALLRQVVFGAQDIAHCAAATLFLRTEHDTLRFDVRTYGDDALPVFEIPLHDRVTGQPQHQYVAPHVALSGHSVLIDDVEHDTRFDLAGTKRFSERTGFRTVSMLTVALAPRPGQVIGVLQLLNAQDPHTGQAVPFEPGIVGFVEALATQAAVALDNQRLLDAQKDLLDATIQIIAGAIDAKSPHTGGHCERVPELALMLAQAACDEQTGPLADFRFTTDDEWREFRIGAWLHDCGKVTTPEYVVDKATKLETLYNRLHEIRMRFEVLLRDAQIERLLALHERGEARATADARYDARRAELLADFAFVAECNLGGEFMDPARTERLHRLAQQTWVRHFDDRLGLSGEELRRRASEAPAPLPATEPLLANKAHHLVPRGENKALDPRHGFRMPVPEHLYHHGELHNLGIGRGTLTEEERFKVNEHIIQTIAMLDRMPFPEHLRRVPEYAGTHHETLTGTGYPRQLTEKDLSIPARIMAVADIFEALTASDRPYRPAKTLSESVKILASFSQKRHIDPHLFELFLTSGVYLRYAHRFLQPEQIDTVDLASYLTPPAP